MTVLGINEIITYSQRKWCQFPCQFLDLNSHTAPDIGSKYHVYALNDSGKSIWACMYSEWVQDIKVYTHCTISQIYRIPPLPPHPRLHLALTFLRTGSRTIRETQKHNVILLNRNIRDIYYVNVKLSMLSMRVL